MTEFLHRQADLGGKRIRHVVAQRLRRVPSVSGTVRDEGAKTRAANAGTSRDAGILVSSLCSMTRSTACAKKALLVTSATASTMPTRVSKDRPL